MWRARLLLVRKSSSIQSKNLLNHTSIQSLNPFNQIPKSFSSSTQFTGEKISKSLSKELLKDPTTQSLSLIERLDLHFSHIQLTPHLLLQTLNDSPHAGRTVLDFHNWVSKRPGFLKSDETFSFLIDYLGRRKDFKAIHEVLVDGKGITGKKSLESAIDRLVRAGRDAQTVAFFEKMESEYGFERNKENLKLVVGKLCEYGFASYAEKMVKSLANEFFPDEEICEMLVKGWCVDGKLDEARRLAGEISRGGFELGTVAYNAILDCVCKLCRKKDGFRMEEEAEKILLEMDYEGIPRNTETFNVLISNLCKIRKTEEGLGLFNRMGEWGCLPDSNTYLVLIKSLFQAARVGEGDEMIDRMKSAGFGDALDKKTYFSFLTVLCGIERVDHAMKIFQLMKKGGCEPGIKTYELLMEKLCAHGKVERANALFREATKRGVPVEMKVYKLDPRFAKKPKAKKSKEPKRLTLPEKMAKKRTRLRKLRLSYVKKPKDRMRKAY